VLAVIAVIGWAIAWRAMRPGPEPGPEGASEGAPRPLVRLDVDLGPEVALPSLGPVSHDVILSPDGTRLVYLSGNPARLYTRRLDQFQEYRTPRHGRRHIPVLFEPDGRWVGFFAAPKAKLNKISVEGGAVVHSRVWASSASAPHGELTSTSSWLEVLRFSCWSRPEEARPLQF
jgi:hypothetical protein